MADDGAGRLWYFGYGSNLDPDTFLGRRGMAPSTVHVARLAGYRLAFDIPIGPGERGVANVHPDPASEVWGVLYALTVDECRRLDRSEGVGSGVYERHDVVPVTLEDTAIAAFTYRAAHAVATRKPSPRYMGLILAGARHHGLPARWLERLGCIPLAIDERVVTPPVP